MVAGNRPASGPARTPGTPRWPCTRGASVGRGGERERGAGREGEGLLLFHVSQMAL